MNILYYFLALASVSSFEIHPVSRGVSIISKFFVSDKEFTIDYIKKIRNVLQMPASSDHPSSIDVVLPKNDHRWLNKEELYCRIYDGSENEQLIFWIHGGGFAIGNIYNDDAIVTMLQKETNNTIISLSYGLAPENKYPQGLNDVCDAIELIIDSYEKEKIPAIVLAGESAGGHLCLGAYYRLVNHRKYIKKLALIYPPITPSLKGVHGTSDNAKINGLLTAASLNQLYKNYIPKGLPLSTLRALFPKNYIKLFNNLSILLITAKYDILHEEIIEFSSLLSNATLKEYNDIHGFFGRFGHGTEALEYTGTWIKS
jgi:acetyl esterase